MSLQKYDIVVVGSGMSGLTCAARAARDGYSVLVAEQAPVFGGYLNPFTRQGYTFDTGLHYVGKCKPEQPFSLLLERLGLSDVIRFREITPDRGAEHRFPDFTFTVPSGEEELEKRMTDLLPAHAKTIRRFCTYLRRLERAFEALSPSDNSGRIDLLEVLKTAPVFVRSMLSTVESIANGFTHDPILQALLSIYSFEAGVPPSTASGMMNILFRHYSDGFFYPVGGSGAIKDALIDTIRKHGGELKTNSPVTRILPEDDKFLLTAGDEQYSASTVVWAASPVDLYLHVLPENRVPQTRRRRVARTEPSWSAFCAYIGTSLDLRTAGVPDGVIARWASRDMNENFHRNAGLELDSFMITSSSLKDPTGDYAPQGKYSLEVATFLPFDRFQSWAHTKPGARGEEYEELKERLGNALVERTCREIPGLADKIEFVEYSTPLTNAWWTRSPGGGCYGPAQTVRQMDPLRFNDRSGIPGLYLCGAATATGGIFPAGFSGERAAIHAGQRLEKRARRAETSPR